MDDNKIIRTVEPLEGRVEEDHPETNEEVAEEDVVEEERPQNNQEALADLFEVPDEEDNE